MRTHYIASLLVLAFASGGMRYGLQVAAGLVAMPCAAWLGLLLSN